MSTLLANGFVDHEGRSADRATLLRARAVIEAAASIEVVVGKKLPDDATIVAMAVSEIPRFQNHIAYRTQLGIVNCALPSWELAADRRLARAGVQFD
jgi:hypothetical protein